MLLSTPKPNRCSAAQCSEIQGRVQRFSAEFKPSAVHASAWTGNPISTHRPNPRFLQGVWFRQRTLLVCQNFSRGFRLGTVQFSLSNHSKASVAVAEQQPVGPPRVLLLSRRRLLPALCSPGAASSCSSCADQSPTRRGPPRGARRPPPLLTFDAGKRDNPPPPPAAAFPTPDLAVPVEQIGFSMTGSEDVKGLAASLGGLHMEASPSTEKEVDWHGDVDDWDDASDSEGHDSILDRDWAHRKNQFVKMGYRDGITEGQKDAAQEGFNIGFGQSVHVGYKWGLVRGITSALDSLPDSVKEKLLLDDRRRGKLKDLQSSVQQISSEGALQLFHESILQDNPPPEESRLQTIPNDLLLLLRECPDIQVPEELTRVP